MLPKSIQIPRPKFKTIEEAQEWAENLYEFLEKFHSMLYNEFNEQTKIAVRGKDGTIVHGFGEF